MKKCLLSAFIALSAVFSAQTTLISPTVNNGGFESGETGWTIVNGSQTNAWRVSTNAAAGFSGVNSIYISNSTSAPFAQNYSTSNSSTVHFYRDVTFPAGETNVNLTFDYMSNGEGSLPYLYDYLRVYVVPTSYVPSEGDLPDISTYPDNWTFNLKGNTWQNASINIPTTAIGNTTAAATKRLLFVWRNDGSAGEQPPGAIDNITLVSSALNCPTVTAPSPNAQNLSLTPTITWSTVPTATSYKLTVGTTPGGTQILNNVNMGTATSYTFPSALATETTYYYSVNASSATLNTGNCQTLSFKTGCGTLAAPYTQNFSSGSVPSCWAVENPTYTGTETNANWRFSGTPDYGTTNNGRTPGSFAWVDASTPYSGLHTVNLVSPFINLTGLTTPTITFEWFKNHATNASGNPSNYDNNKLTMAVNDGSGWVNLWNDTTNAATWREVEHQLPTSYLNKTIQVRFTVDKDVAGNGYFYDNVLLDDFKVDNKSLCQKPAALTLGTFSGTNRNVTWTAPTIVPAMGYEVYYSTNSTSPTSQTVANMTNITATTASIPGSTTASTYVWVRSVCSATAKSDWTSSVNFILPPTNDLCADAISLTVGPNFDAYPLVGNLTGATSDVQPNCAYNLAENVWFKFIVPASGSVTLETRELAGSNMDDTLIAVYSGTCGSLTEVDCNDDGLMGYFSEIQLSNQTPGSTMYLHVQKYSSSTDDGPFRVAAYDASILSTQEATVGKKVDVYPNPFKDVVNISNAESYTSAVVVDMSGRVLKSFDKVTSQLNLNGLSSGVYVLNLMDKDGKKSSIKIVKQ